MSTQSSFFSATRPGAFAEAVSLAAHANHREPSTWVTKPRQPRTGLRSAMAGIAVTVAVVGTTLLMVA